MTLDNFIPSVWAGKLLAALRTALVYAQPAVINDDYEGEISDQGDNVRINMIGDPTITDYTKNNDLSGPEALTDAQLTLVISQAKAFNFAVDDIDAVQQKPKVMSEAAARAAYGLKKVFDSYVASLYTDIATGNFVGTDASPKTDLGTAGKAYEHLLRLGTLLDEADTPEDGRFVVVPPWYEEALLLDDRFVKAGVAESEDRLMNGQVRQAAGFAILKSNQVPNTAATKYKVIAGHNSAWSKAEQIVKTEAYRPEKRFSDALKGLHVYGAKVLRPSNLACLVANRP